MPSRRQLFSATAAIVLAGIPAAARQQPKLDEVLEKSAAYVQRFREQLSGIVAEETYRQQISHTGRLNEAMILANGTRDLKSDLLLVKPSDTDRYVELRDVFEVDGKPVREREARLEALLRDPRAAGRIGAIVNESASYNVGTIERNVNTPLMALQFLDRAMRDRVRFKHVDKPKPVFADTADAAADAGVFRVSTEMWTVEFRERGGATLIRRPNGRDLPAHGRFWIDPNTGAVLISELVVDGGGVIATITVSYQSEPLMGFLVPIEMRESYVRYGERISGHARYGRFRLLKG